jgi:hypothetical protein
MSTWLQKLTKPSPTSEAPARHEFRRNDLLVAGLVCFSLFLGFGIRNQVYTASKSVQLGEDLPRIAYPDRWRPRAAADVLLHAVDAGSPSTFDTQLTVAGRALRPDESLENARADRGMKLIATLPGYRELAAEQMRIYDDQPALVSTYAYIADPTREAGANGLPVVVEAQDIMFFDKGQFLVTTLAADASAWDDAQRDFQIVTNSMRLRPLPEPTTIDLATPVPATGPSSSFSGALQSGSQSDRQPEGGN